MPFHSQWCLWRQAVFWGIFPIPDALFSQTPGEQLTQQNRRSGGWEGEGYEQDERGGGWEKMKEGVWEVRSLGIKEWNDEDGANGQSKVRWGWEWGCEGQQRRVEWDRRKWDAGREQGDGGQRQKTSEQIERPDECGRRGRKEIKVWGKEMGGSNDSGQMWRVVPFKNKTGATPYALINPLREVYHYDRC